MEDSAARLAVLNLVKATNTIVHILFEFRRQWISKGYDHDLMMAEHDLSDALESLTRAIDVMVESQDDKR
jgi:hypothetical protein